MLSLPSSRVQIVGSKFDDDCREIRTFLSMNRIPYEWTDRERSAHLAMTDQACEIAGLSVVVDGSFCVSHPPAVRKVLGHSNIKMTERYAKLGRRHITRTGNTARELWKLLEPANENAMFAHSSHG